MKLKFLGTKGEIEESSSFHQYHSSLLVEENSFRLLIDHGVISQPLEKIKPSAILITHGHPDHFLWLKKDEDYQGKIYVIPETEKLAKFKKNFEIIPKNEEFTIGPFRILAYKVVHSLRAPAVGFRVICKDKTFVYNPDIVVMEDKKVLEGVDLYIGDGSSFKANLVRKKGDQVFGHARMQTQINWCREFKITKIIFTHLGKEPLEIGDQMLEKLLAQEGMTILIAHDGWEYQEIL